MLEQALEYHENGFSIIPIRPDKRPLLAEWAHYQKERPSKADVQRWWIKHPNAMIGIITGAVSGVCVVDADSPLGYKHAKKYIGRKPDVRSPAGWHWYWKYEDGVTCSNRFLPDLDFKSEGGYIIAPPSVNGTGKPYKLTGEIGRNHTLPSEIKEMLTCNNHSHTRCHTGGVTTLLQPVTVGVEGRRDDDLFRLANHLVKSGMHSDLITEYLNFFASNCNPPFPPKDVKAKIASALKRDGKTAETFMEEVEEWIDGEAGLITNAHGYVAMQCVTRQEKATLRQYLKRLADKKKLVRTDNGAYRKCDDTIEWLDVQAADTTPFPIVWPFGVEERVRLPSGGIVLVAGQQEAGKTAYLLNLARLNANRGKDVVFVSTETNAQGLKVRMQGWGEIGVKIADVVRGVKFGYIDETNMADAIENYGLEDSILILDYLEVNDAFYLIAQKLAEIFKKMKGGVAIIGCQMHEDKIIGGKFGFHKPEMVLTLKEDKKDGGTRLTIEKGRWWTTTHNPKYDSMMFWTRHGCVMEPMSGTKGEWGKL